MPYAYIDPSKTALLFFDVLKAGFNRPDMTDEERERKQAMLANCVKLREMADQVGVPVFYARPNHRPDGRDAALLYTDTDGRLRPWSDPEQGRLDQYKRRTNLAGHEGSEVVDEIRPQPSDYVILKNRWNAFFQTNLELSLRTRGIDTIMLAGSATEVGITSTAYGARDRDFNLIIVRDATTGGDPDDHQFFMERVFPRMARVRTTIEALQMMETGAAAVQQ